jgi:enterochelin esterase-like enzyme
MILVGVDGINALGGSFYADSPVTGMWAQAIHRDLVTYIDGNYRSVPRADARGVAGFSMGGFGALDLAMRHPDVFGSVYALSPGLFAPGGLETTQMFADDEVIADFLALQQRSDADDVGRASADLRFSVAYGAAFAPDPDAGFPHVSYPFTAVGSARDESVWARWEAGYGGVAEEVAEFEGNLRSLRGIALDYGTNDQYAWIPDGVAHLTEQLVEHRIPVQVTSHDGGHGSIGARAETVMFPFFAEMLTS